MNCRLPSHNMAAIRMIDKNMGIPKISGGRGVGNGFQPNQRKKIGHNTYMRGDRQFTTQWLCE